MLFGCSGIKLKTAVAAVAAAIAAAAAATAATVTAILACAYLSVVCVCMIAMACCRCRTFFGLQALPASATYFLHIPVKARLRTYANPIQIGKSNINQGIAPPFAHMWLAICFHPSGRWSTCLWLSVCMSMSMPMSVCLSLSVTVCMSATLCHCLSVPVTICHCLSLYVTAFRCLFVCNCLHVDRNPWSMIWRIMECEARKATWNPRLGSANDSCCAAISALWSKTYAADLLSTLYHTKSIISNM